MRRRRFKTMDDRIVDTSTVVARDDPQQAPIFDASTGEQINSFAKLLTVTFRTQYYLRLHSELNLSMIKRMVNKNVESKKEQAAQEPSDENEEADSEEMVGSLDNGADGGDTRTSPDATSEGSPQPKSPGITHLTVLSAEPPISDGEASNEHKLVPQSLSLKKTSGPDNQTLLRLLEQGEQLHSMFRCARIQGLDTIEGLLLFGREHYYVVDGFTLLKTREIRDLDFLPEQ